MKNAKLFFIILIIVLLPIMSACEAKPIDLDETTFYYLKYAFNSETGEYYSAPTPNNIKKDSLENLDFAEYSAFVVNFSNKKSIKKVEATIEVEKDIKMSFMCTTLVKNNEVLELDLKANTKNICVFEFQNPSKSFLAIIGKENSLDIVKEKPIKWKLTNLVIYC